MNDLVAQLVEHITFNDGALGSSPSGITETLMNSGSFLCHLLIYYILKSLISII
jgi:hypothetical protein